MYPQLNGIIDWDKVGEYLVGLTRKYPWLGEQLEKLEKYGDFCKFDGNFDSVETFLLAATLGAGAALIANELLKEGQKGYTEKTLR